MWIFASGESREYNVLTGKEGWARTDTTMKLTWEQVEQLYNELYHLLAEHEMEKISQSFTDGQVVTHGHQGRVTHTYVRPEFLPSEDEA